MEMIYWLYNFGADYGAESKFGRHKELIIPKILRTNIVLLSQVICHVAIFLKNVNN